MLRYSRNLLIAFFTIAGLAAGSLLAQGPMAATQPSPASAPAGIPQSLLNAIPDQALAFVAVANMQQAGAKVDQLIADLNLSQMMPGSILDKIREEQDFGPGFNANGGFALAMLDPNLFGYTPQDITEEKPGPDKPAPVVYLVAGTDVKTLFNGFKASSEEGLTKLESQYGEVVYAKMADGYILLAEDTQPLKVIAQGKGSVMSRLSGPHKMLISQSDALGFADVKALRPWIHALFVKLAQQAEAAPQRGRMFMSPPGMMRAYMGFWENLVSQIDLVTIGANLNKEGITLARVATFDPNSAIAKMSGGIKFASGPMLTQMPGLPYVLAIGTEPMVQISPETQAEYRKWIANAMSAFSGDTLKKEQIDRLAQISADNLSHVKSERMFLGASPAGSGVFGLAVIYNVDNADAVLASLPEAIQIQEQAMNSLISRAMTGMMHQAGSMPATAPASQPKQQMVSMKYTPNAMTVADAQISTLDLVIPQLSEKMDANARAILTKVLGEENIRVYIAKASDKIVVVTLGGAKAFLTEAITAARDGKDLAADASVAGSLKHLPKDSVGAMVISLPNLFRQISDGISAVEGPDAAQRSPLASVNFTATAPIAAGRAQVTDGDYGRIFIPTDVLSDLVRNVMMIQMRAMGGAQRGGPGGSQPNQPGQHDF